MAITLTGFTLSVTELNRLARSEVELVVDAEALDRVERAHATLERAAADGAVYGATTGVGANRNVSLDTAAAGQAFRFWRSSCTGVGKQLDPDVARATMLVRLNQILAGGSGLSPSFTQTLVDALEAGRTPLLHDGASIGTGDLSALAELALTLAGERAWSDGAVTNGVPAERDGLPFISSSAVVLASAAAAVERLEELLHSLTVVSALSSLAMRGSVQPALPPHDPGFEAHAELFLAIAQPAPGGPDPAARVQDPFGLRALPQVHSAAVEALAHARTIIERGINGVHENPCVDSGTVIHNGRFHTAKLGLAVDSLRTAVMSVAVLSSARISKLMDPAITGLTPFLSDGAPGSSGLMMTEYVAEDAVAELRLLAAPASGASITISLGVEEHASFASQSVRALARMLDQLELVAATELIAAFRALVIDPARAAADPAARVMSMLEQTLSSDLVDRPLDEDFRNGRRALLSLVAAASAQP